MKTFILLLVVAALTAATIAVGAAGAQKKIPPSGSKKSEEERVYELPATGRNLDRQSGGWINVQTSGAQLIVKFYDKDKKPVPSDAARATARFRYAAKSDMERTVLNREGDALASPGNVRPPHNFFVTLTLLRDDNASGAISDVIEVFNFKYP